jgi:hypothetical protein
MTVLTTTRKYLFTTVTIGQMTSYFQVTSGIHTHTFPWIWTFICSNLWILWCIKLMN